MKITDRFKRKETRYSSIDSGIVFKYENEYYMTTDELRDNYEDIYNCVNLKNGELNNFDDETMVEVLEAEMIVK